MPRVSFKCSHCDRKFSMPAHLARHMNTIHAAKTGRKAHRKKTSKVGGKMRRATARGRKTAGRSTLRVGVIRQSDSDATTRLLGEIQACHGDLMSKRMSLDSQIERLANAMKVLGGGKRATSPRQQPRVGRPPGTGGREGSLKNFIVRVLRQHTKPLGPSDISARVVKAGFKTKAKDITKAVSNTIPELKNVKRVGFGLYKLSGK